MESDKYLIGIHLAERLQGTKFAAVLDPAVPFNRFTANVANPSGANVMITNNFDEARRWLESAD